MQAIILAAGMGTRMGNLTKNVPKPMLKIGEKPILEYIINLLVVHKFRDIGINLFYKGNQIQKYFGNGSRFGAKITYVRERALSGTAGGVKKVANALKITDDFLVISGKMLVNFDLTNFYKFHTKMGGIASLCCYWRPKTKILNKSGIVLFNQDDLISKFVERPQTIKQISSQWVNSSVYIFRPEIINYISSSKNHETVIDLAKDIFPKLLLNEKIYAYPINRKRYYQLGIDTPERIIQAKKDLVSRKFIPS